MSVGQLQYILSKIYKLEPIYYNRADSSMIVTKFSRRSRKMIFNERYLERELLMSIRAREEILKFFIDAWALKLMLGSRNQKSFYGKAMTHQ